MEIPKTLKNLKGFLGLTSYHHKFIKNFDQIETPLRRLLKGGILLDSRSNQIFWKT